MTIEIHFWDMDNTLLDNDCDVSWKEFLIEKKIAPESDRALARRFWDDYAAGNLDSKAFIDFQLREFKGKTAQEMNLLAAEHFNRMVRDRVYRRAMDMVKIQRRSGALACMATATNEIIAAPVASYFGFDGLIATRLETAGGLLNGMVAGPFLVGAAKIPPMRDYCRQHSSTIEKAHYYGDSMVDIPVFQAVGNPVLVNPAQQLAHTARKQGWPILYFRN
jgi:HAD superfamily hydrolase (TIGR01490 family)